MADEIFRTTLMGGFDKDDVLNKVQIMKEEAYAEKTKLVKAGKEKDAKIEELIRITEQQNSKITELETKKQKKFLGIFG